MGARMRATFGYVACLMAVLGCGAAAQHGSFVKGQEGAQAGMGGDAATLLAERYSPDRDGFALQHESKDAFGRALLTDLRNQGFRVSEKQVSDAGYMPMSYIADGVQGTKLLRVEVQVGDVVFSRVYTPTAAGLNPSGPWTSLEKVGRDD